MTTITSVHLAKSVSTDLMLDNTSNHVYSIYQHQDLLFRTQKRSFALARGNNLAGENLGQHQRNSKKCIFIIDFFNIWNIFQYFRL